MKTFDTFSIRNKVLVSFAVVIAFVMMAVGAGYLQLNQVKTSTRQVVPASVQVDHLRQLAVTIESLESNLDQINVHGGETYKEDAVQDLENLSALLQAIKDNASEKDSPAWGEFDRAINGLQTKVNALLNMGPETSSGEMNEGAISAYAYIASARQWVNELAEETLSQLRGKVGEQENIISSVNSQFLVLAAIILTLGVALALILSKRISEPIVELENSTKEIIKGNLEIKVKTRSKDEVGELATTFNIMVRQLKAQSVERQQAESRRDAMLESLRESEERFKSMVANIPGVVYRCKSDPDWTPHFISDAIEELCGYPASDFFHNRTFASLIHPVDREMSKECIRQALEQRQAYAIEYRISDADSNLRWVYERGRGVVGADGQIQYLDGAIFDITERKRAEQSLHKKTRQQEHLIETSRHLTASLDVKEVLSRIGSGAKEILRAHSCAIYLLEEDGETLNPVVVIDPLYEEEVLSTPLNVETSFTGQAIKAKRGMIFNDAGHDTSGQQIPGTPEWDEEHIIVAPFVTDDVILGAMTLNHAEDRFSKEDLALAETFASYAVTALKNAQTHRDLQHEVDERKRAEDALRKSEARYRNVVEDQTEFIVRWLPDGTRTFVNGSYCRYFNQSRDELIGSNIFSKLAKEDQERVQRQAKALTPQNPIVTGENRASLSDGKVVWQWWSNRAIFDAEGQILEYQSIGRDITERKQAEAEVLRLQHMLQNITDSMPSALIALDPAGRVLTWNPAAEVLTGQTATQIQGQSLWQTCPELIRYRELFENVLHTGQVAHRHKEQLTSETETVFLDVDVFPLAADGIEGVVLRIDDVTQRVQLEDMMLQSAKMASVGGLAAGVAHEINNPLGAMIQSAQMLQMAFDTQRPRTRERLQGCGVEPTGLDRYLQERNLATYLDGIRASGARAAKIVSDLLSFSRKGSAKATPHDLNTLVEQTLELAATDYDLRKKYDFRNLEIVRELALDLPAVTCDGQQIQQVILNLVRNAAQAIAGEMERRERDGDRGDVYQPRLVLRTALTSTSALTSTWVRLEVEDNGPGIPDELRARLFSPFVTTKEVGEGTGLGLWLCWAIVVERHEGRILHEQDKRGGSRFVVELPLKIDMGN